MKTTKILTAVSAAALLGISSFALAQGTSGQGTSGGGAGGAGAPSGNTMQRQQETPPSGSSTQSSPSMSKDSMSKDDMKSNRAQSRETGKDAQKSQAQGKEMGKDTMGRDTQKSQAQDKGMSKDAPKAAQSPTDSKSQMSQDKDAAKSGSTVGAAPSGAVNLTTEQRTTIRQEVLTERAPRATNINFSVNVGTVVPSSVRVIEVPPTIVRIQPRWKGYRYFVYNDEIIIVEPRTLKIVAVLDV
jgi:Protein of unknown function (DUF1236)